MAQTYASFQHTENASLSSFMYDVVPEWWTVEDQ